MLISIPYLAAVMFLAPASGPVASSAPAQWALTDTGTATAPSLVVLTPTVVTAYGAVEKALAAYWAAHPDQAKAALRQGVDVDVVIPSRESAKQAGNRLTAKQSDRIPDYPRLVQQDTAVAAIFTQNHFAPAQFGPTRMAVRKAIVTVLDKDKQAVDTTTFTGKNQAVVLAHRAELAIDWSAEQGMTQQMQGIMTHLFQGVAQKALDQMKADTLSGDVAP